MSSNRYQYWQDALWESRKKLEAAKRDLVNESDSLERRLIAEDIERLEKDVRDNESRVKSHSPWVWVKIAGGIFVVFLFYFFLDSMSR